MRPLALLAAAVALLAAGCGSSRHTGAPAPATTTRAVPQLTSINQLRDTFNTREGLPRLIVLISPT